MAINKFWYVVMLAVLVMGASVWVGLHPKRLQPIPMITAAPQPQGQPMLPIKQITVGNTLVAAEIADTSQEQVSGLSGRASLAEGTGMLFIFPHATEIGFWMKDMLFPIDMIFADATGTIVTIAANAQPSSYPDIFNPTKPAKYVLEVPAGFAVIHGIAAGQKIVLQ